MKPNAFIDPKAFGHFVIMLPNIPNRPRTFCAKRFFNPPRTVSGRADIRFTDPTIPPYPTSHKYFFAQKGSHPSDTLCTNALR